MNAVELTKKAGELVGGDRAKQHGDMRENFANIALLWNAYLGEDSNIEPEQVGVMMALLKVARMKGGIFNADDFIDAIGYIACAGEVTSYWKSINNP